VPVAGPAVPVAGPAVPVAGPVLPVAGPARRARARPAGPMNVELLYIDVH
jgi:hypothetical protein